MTDTTKENKPATVPKAKQAEEALEELKRWTAKAGLTLHPEKTRIVDARLKKAGFDFLGYHFEQGLKWPRKKSLKKLKDAIRRKTRAQQRAKSSGNHRRRKPHDERLV